MLRFLIIRIALDLMANCQMKFWILIAIIRCSLSNYLSLLTDWGIQLIFGGTSGVTERSACHMRKALLTSSELRFALKSFAVKICLFFVIEFLICQFDDSRYACRLVARGFLPSLFVFALMDLLVIPRLRRRIRAHWSSQDDGGFSPILKTS